MPRVLLLLPTSTYRAPDFVRAAKDLGVDLIVGSEVAPPYPAPGRAIAVPLDDPTAAATLIESLDRDHAVDAVVAVDDQGVIVAATAGERMGFPHNPPDAVAATRDKAEPCAPGWRPRKYPNPGSVRPPMQSGTRAW